MYRVIYLNQLRYAVEQKVDQQEQLPVWKRQTEIPEHTWETVFKGNADAVKRYLAKRKAIEAWDEFQERQIHDLDDLDD